MTTFTVTAVCTSEMKGTQKRSVAAITLLPDQGVAGDAHAGPGDRQVSFLAGEAIDTMRAKGLTLEDGAFGENIVTRGIDWTVCSICDRIQIGECVLELSRIGKECHQRCAIYYAAGDCIMPRSGVFGRVIRGGTFGAGAIGTLTARGERP